MKSLENYRIALIKRNYSIHEFSLEGLDRSFALVKVKSGSNFFERVLGLDIQETIFRSRDFNEVAQKADKLLGEF